MYARVLHRGKVVGEIERIELPLPEATEAPVELQIAEWKSSGVYHRLAMDGEGGGELVGLLLRAVTAEVPPRVLAHFPGDDVEDLAEARVRRIVRDELRRWGIRPATPPGFAG